MDKLIRAVFQLRDFKIRTDDDFVDRLNRQYTPGVVVILAILISVKQYVGAAITCWTPAHFTAAHVDYANTVCWVSSTYYVPMEHALPEAHQPRRMISYYQWVPLILLGQALCSFLPCLLWRFLNRRVGVNLPAIVEAARATQKAIYSETRDKSLRYIVMQLDSFLRTRDGRPPACLARHLCCARGNHLTCAYLLSKLLYLASSVGQLFVLDVFLGFNSAYHMYGVHVLAEVLGGRDWPASLRFPRVTQCDFRVRQQTNVHRYTVQCVLPINLFNEKIFLFLWFWLLAMALLTAVNVVHWATTLAVVRFQTSAVERALRSVEALDKRESRLAARFTTAYLGRDGLLVLRLVAHNAGDLVAAEVTHGLWTHYGSAAAVATRPDSGAASADSNDSGGGRWGFVKRVMGRRRNNDDRRVIPENI